MELKPQKERRILEAMRKGIFKVLGAPSNGSVFRKFWFEFELPGNHDRMTGMTNDISEKVRANLQNQKSASAQNADDEEQLSWTVEQ